MLYTVEIPGKLPTLIDHARAKVTHSIGELDARTEKKIAACLKDAPAFDDHVYVGVYWVRADAAASLDEVAYAKPHILDALRSVGAVKQSKMCFLTDLGFRVNSRNPRTIVCVADTLEEISSAELSGSHA